MGRLRTALTGALSALLAACSGGGPVAERASLAHGPFEIVAEGRRISTGTFPNISGNPFATMEVTGFTVRWRGQPVTVQHGQRSLSRFWRVLRVTDAPRPTLLVSTTDFILLSEQDGKLQVEPVGDPSTNYAELQWLDARDGQPAPPQGFGIQKVDPQAGTEIAGGRWLRLASNHVLDVQTLKLYPIRPWVPTGQPMSSLNGGGIRAVVFSPGRTQYATVGSGNDYQNNGEHFSAVVVIDIPSGDAYGVRFDPMRVRWRDFEDATPAWFGHYFRWTRAADGRERLELRADAKPLPWQGRFIDFGGGRLEWRLSPVKPAMHTALIAFVQSRGGRPAPDWLDPKKDRPGTFTIDGCPSVIAVSENKDTVGMHAPGIAGARPELCSGTIRQLGEAFDAELRRGGYADLFADS